MRPIQFKDYNREEASKNLVVLCALGALFFPLFGILDYILHQEHLTALSVIRYTTALIFVIFFMALKSFSFLYSRPFHVSFIILILASISITLMCIELGIETSDYYQGLNLVILAFSVSIPIQSERMIAFNLVPIVIYLAGHFLVAEGLIYNQDGLLINRLFFMISTAIFGSVGAILRMKLKSKWFITFSELKEAEGYLRGEVQGQKENLKELAKATAKKNKELKFAYKRIKVSEKKALKASQSRDEFISIASHELTNPLSALRLNLEMLSECADDSNMVKQLLPLTKKGMDNLDHILRLVDDMKNLSGLERGRFNLRPKTINLKDSIISAIDGLAPSSKSLLRLDIDHNLIGNWDPLRINQVVVNLINNAIKYGGERPIKVKLYKDRDCAVLEVVDQGRGIKKENLDSIFEIFDRQENMIDIEGLGLGLYITKKIVAAHNGKVSVKSEVGRGSVFRVELPLNLNSQSAINPAS